MSDFGTPQCYECENFDHLNPEKAKCSAFPKGIPQAIFNNSHDHREPFEGDNGIRFQEIKGE